MGQSLSNVLVHLVFSTKSRNAWLQDTWREELHKYITEIIRECKGDVIIINSVEDHVHLLLPLPRTISISALMREIKSNSSGWIRRQQREMQQFQWQVGYGAFSVSPSHKLAVKKYIQGQREHHAKVSFKDEFRRLLGLYEVDYDEAYVWE